MKMLLIPFIVLALLTCSAFAGDEEHGLSTITGTNIDLKTYDHAFAGSIGQSVVWGFLNEETFTGELLIRKYGQNVRALFQRGDDGIGGTITRVDGDRSVDTAVALRRVDGEAKQILLTVNGEEITVQLTPEGVADGHFVNPKFTTTVGGKDIEYTLYGKACFGMSVQFAMMIIGASVY